MATESKMETAPKWAWTVWTVWTVLVIAILSVGVIKVIPSGARKTPTTTVAQQTQPVQPVTKTIQVGKEWVNLPLSPRQRFDITPCQQSVLIKRIDGKVFRREPQKLFDQEGKEVSDIGRPIPGYSLTLKSGSKSGEVIDVIVTTWPKSSG